MTCAYRKCRKRARATSDYCSDNCRNMENQAKDRDAMKTRFSHLYTDRTWAGLLSQEYLLKPVMSHG